MSTAVIIFCICVFLVEMMVFYSPLYYFTYGLMKFDRKIGDNRLVVILLALSIVLSLVFFRLASSLLYRLFF